MAIGTDTSVIYKGSDGPKGIKGFVGSPGRLGYKGPTGDRVFNEIQAFEFNLKKPNCVNTTVKKRTFNFLQNLDS